MIQFFMNSENIVSAVWILISILYFGGILLLVEDDLIKLWYRLKLLLRDEQSSFENLKRESYIKETFNKFVEGSMGKNFSSKTYWKITGLIFIITFVIMSRLSTLLAAFIISLIVAIMPTVIMKFRLERKRTKSSFEADALLTKIIIQYGICNNRIDDAIEKIISDKEVPETSVLLYEVLLVMRGTRNNAELLKATELFAYRIGTNWAKMLAHNIYMASAYNSNITLSLEDILVQLRDARALNEETKRLNAETGRLFTLIPIFYLGTVFMGIKFGGISFTEFLDNQFGSVAGLICFIAIVLMAVLSYLLISITKNKRFDF